MSEEENCEYVDFYREKMIRIFNSKKDLLTETENVKLQFQSIHKGEMNFIDEMKKYQNKIIAISDLKLSLAEHTQQFLEIQKKNSVLKIKEFSMRKKLLECLPTNSEPNPFFKDCTSKKSGKKLVDLKGLPSNIQGLKLISVKDHDTSTVKMIYVSEEEAKLQQKIFQIQEETEEREIENLKSMNSLLEHEIDTREINFKEFIEFLNHSLRKLESKKEEAKCINKQLMRDFYAKRKANRERREDCEQEGIILEAKRQNLELELSKAESYFQNSVKIKEEFELTKANNYNSHVKTKGKKSKNQANILQNKLFELKEHSDKHISNLEESIELFSKKVKSLISKKDNEIQQLEQLITDEEKRIAENQPKNENPFANQLASADSSILEDDDFDYLQKELMRIESALSTAKKGKINSN